jgi:hypothetical protein
VEAVPPAYTTQDCSGCGERISKSLSVRTHICTNCGLILDRDANAALNIQWRGQRLRGVPAVAGALNREPVGLEPVRSVRCSPRVKAGDSRDRRGRRPSGMCATPTGTAVRDWPARTIHLAAEGSEAPSQATGTENVPSAEPARSSSPALTGGASGGESYFRLGL